MVRYHQFALMDQMDGPQAFHGKSSMGACHSVPAIIIHIMMLTRNQKPKAVSAHSAMTLKKDERICIYIT